MEDDCAASADAGAGLHARHHVLLQAAVQQRTRQLLRLRQLQARHAEEAAQRARVAEREREDALRVQQRRDAQRELAGRKAEHARELQRRRQEALATSRRRDAELRLAAETLLKQDQDRAAWARERRQQAALGQRSARVAGAARAAAMRQRAEHVQREQQCLADSRLAAGDAHLCAIAQAQQQALAARQQLQSQQDSLQHSHLLRAEAEEASKRAYYAARGRAKEEAAAARQAVLAAAVEERRRQKAERAALVRGQLARQAAADEERRQELERRCQHKAARVAALEAERRAMAGALQDLRRNMAVYEEHFRQELDAGPGPASLSPVRLKPALPGGVATHQGADGKAGGLLAGAEGGGASPRILSYSSLQHGSEQGMAYATEALRALLAAEVRREAERAELFAGTRSERDRQKLAELFRQEQDQVAQVAAGLASQMGRLRLAA